MSHLLLSQAVVAIIDRMSLFEASRSIANTGTGSRREGEGFERLVGELWEAVRQQAVAHGAESQFVAGTGRRRWAKIMVGGRSLYLPNNPHAPLADPDAQSSRWLEVVFPVAELVDRFPGEASAVQRYAPDCGPYANQEYPHIYRGLSTKFDDTIVLEEDGVLREKLLMEYKTAKSSGGRQLDGNAHERLSFQVMQYLEVATRYTKCSLVVMANSAFVRYRNKYHVSFHMQADRLSNFAWFSMEYACTAAEYGYFLSGLLAWLFEGKPRQQRSAH